MLLYVVRSAYIRGAGDNTYIIERFYDIDFFYYIPLPSEKLLLYIVEPCTYVLRSIDSSKLTFFKLIIGIVYRRLPRGTRLRRDRCC